MSNPTSPQVSKKQAQSNTRDEQESITEEEVENVGIEADGDQDPDFD